MVRRRDRFPRRGLEGLILRVITNVALGHTNYLGAFPEDIALGSTPTKTPRPCSPCSVRTHDP